MKKFMSNQNGATAIEVCIISAAMAVFLIAAMPSITTGLTTNFTSVGTRISTGK